MSIFGGKYDYMNKRPNSGTRTMVNTYLPDAGIKPKSNAEILEQYERNKMEGKEDLQDFKEEVIARNALIKAPALALEMGKLIPALPYSTVSEVEFWKSIFQEFFLFVVNGVDTLTYADVDAYLYNNILNQHDSLKIGANFGPRRDRKKTIGITGAFCILMASTSMFVSSQVESSSQLDLSDGSTLNTAGGEASAGEQERLILPPCTQFRKTLGEVVSAIPFIGGTLNTVTGGAVDYCTTEIPVSKLPEKEKDRKITEQEALLEKFYEFFRSRVYIDGLILAPFISSLITYCIHRRITIRKFDYDIGAMIETHKLNYHVWYAMGVSSFNMGCRFFLQNNASMAVGTLAGSILLDLGCAWAMNKATTLSIRASLDEEFLNKLDEKRRKRRSVVRAAVFAGSYVIGGFKEFALMISQGSLYAQAAAAVGGTYLTFEATNALANTFQSLQAKGIISLFNIVFHSILIPAILYDVYGYPIIYETWEEFEKDQVSQGITFKKDISIMLTNILLIRDPTVPNRYFYNTSELERFISYLTKKMKKDPYNMPSQVEKDLWEGTVKIKLLKLIEGSGDGYKEKIWGYFEKCFFDGEGNAKTAVTNLENELKHLKDARELQLKKELVPLALIPLIVNNDPPEGVLRDSILEYYISIQKGGDDTADSVIELSKIQGSILAEVNKRLSADGEQPFEELSNSTWQAAFAALKIAAKEE